MKPAKLLDRDLPGRRVRLRYQLERRDGIRFPAGMVMRIDTMWRGRASLATIAGPSSVISGINKSAFELVPDETPSSAELIPAPPPKAKKPGRRELLQVIGKIQTLAGRAKNAYQNDRAVERWSKVIEPLDEIFDLCLHARRMDP